MLKRDAFEIELSKMRGLLEFSAGAKLIMAVATINIRKGAVYTY
jgi:hypothetical protein